MEIKNICKKCGTKEYSVNVSKKIKTKYYRICENCMKKKRLFPNRIAFHFYFKLCEYETALATKDLHGDKEFAKKYFNFLDKFKKEYKYIYGNLILFIEYIYNNNAYHKKFVSKFSMGDLLSIIKNYKEPLTDENCIFIFGELDDLLKKRKDVSDEK